MMITPLKIPFLTILFITLITTNSFAATFTEKSTAEPTGA